MYRGFNLELNNLSEQFQKINIKNDNKILQVIKKAKYLKRERGNALFNDYVPNKNNDYYFQDIWDEVQDNLDDFLDIENDLDGSAIQNYWFPEVEADIFISHSHADEDLAIYLACWLEDTFDLNVFIDSQVWGYKNELIEKVIQINKKKKLKERSNITGMIRCDITAHVDVMLSTALTRMIDKCEAIFFLNTPSSISAEDLIKKTYSPWIYYEIAVTQMIRKKKFRKEKYGKLKAILESVNIKYKVNLEHLYPLDNNNLEKWQNKKIDGNFQTKNLICLHKHSLDCLYELFPLKKISNYQNLYG